MQLRNRNLDGASNLDGTEDMEEDEVPLIENDVEIVDKKSVKSSQYFICLPNVTKKSSSKLSLDISDGFITYTFMTYFFLILL